MVNKQMREIEGCTPLTIYIPDIFIEQGYVEQLKEFFLGVIDDAIHHRQRELGVYPPRKNAF